MKHATHPQRCDATADRSHLRGNGLQDANHLYAGRTREGDAMTEWEDHIVAEVRAIRDAHAARFHYDLQAIYEDIKERERTSGRTYVRFNADGTTTRTRYGKIISEDANDAVLAENNEIIAR